MTTLLQINDNQLRLQLSDGRLINSQGYAWLKLDAVVFDIDTDQAAVKQCRLNPQQINNRYWHQCDQSSIAENSMGLRHAADLIWQHLSQLNRQYSLGNLAILVPSHYQESQLQLLLGVAQACRVSVSALVNKAVAELSKRALSDGVYQHIDVQLHQSVCSTVTVMNGQCSLADVQIAQDVGIHLMQEAILHGLQNVFIQDDRFDPLHDAATEQQLFDQLAVIASAVTASGNANIGVEHQSRLHSISLERPVWDQFLEPFKQALLRLTGSASQVFIDLNDAFGSVQFNALDPSVYVAVEHNSDDDVSRYLQGNKDGDAVLYQTQLSMKNVAAVNGNTQQDSSDDEKQDDKSSVSQGPTHVLLAGTAVPLEQAYINHGAQGFELQKKTQGNLTQLLSDKKLFIINDEQRQQLNVNDRIGSQLVDGILTVIQVV